MRLEVDAVALPHRVHDGLPAHGCAGLLGPQAEVVEQDQDVVGERIGVGTGRVDGGQVERVRVVVRVGRGVVVGDQLMQPVDVGQIGAGQPDRTGRRRSAGQRLGQALPGGCGEPVAEPVDGPAGLRPFGGEVLRPRAGAGTGTARIVS